MVSAIHQHESAIGLHMPPPPRKLPSHLSPHPPTPVFLPGKSHGQRSLEGYSPWGFKESDMTARLNMHSCGIMSIEWSVKT